MNTASLLIMSGSSDRVGLKNKTKLMRHFRGRLCYKNVLVAFLLKQISCNLLVIFCNHTGCAFQMLMNSQRSQTDVAQSPALPTTTITLSLCWVCHQQKESMPCAFCEHNVCEMCVRQCDKCFGVFCAFCSTINYDNHEDRPLCLTCHHEELRQQRNRAAQTGPMQQQSMMWNGQRGLEGYRPLTTQGQMNVSESRKTPSCSHLPFGLNHQKCTFEQRDTNG